MEQNFDMAGLLEWYIDAGVDEVCGDAPVLSICRSKEKPEEKALESVAVKTAAAAVRPAITTLAQTTTSACKNAREFIFINCSEFWPSKNKSIRASLFFFRHHC